MPDRFHHALDTHAGRVERDRGLVVLLLQPPGPDTQLEPPAREHVERGRGLGEQGGMAEVVVEHEAADPESIAHHRGGHQRRDRVQSAHEVVQREVAVVAERIDPADHLDPLFARPGRPPLHAEPKRFVARHC